MKLRMLLPFLLLLPAWAHAQYNGPAVEACRAYAKKEFKAEDQVKDVVFDRDGALTIERYTKKVGSQFVSSVLLGNGAIVRARGPAVELSFICLLADEKRPVFFQWLGRDNAPAAVQCRRGDAKTPRPCLETLLQVAEMDLGQLYALRFQEARERDSKGSGEVAVLAYRKSNDAWRQYREAECARHRDLAPAGMNPDDYQLACTVDLTRRRALDMR
jgi:uncharacterized protein YecT (DUF1311 family)